MMRFKKIYIEITNGCNLNCEFCIGNKRKIKFMSFSEFKLILYKIESYTKYLYFHILGEPLLHPDIVKFVEYASEKGFYINITTNGYLIDKLKDIKSIRQLNISIHSFNIRFWLDGYTDYLGPILEHYGISNIPESIDGFRLSEGVYLSKFHQFIWPDLNNSYYSEVGKCYGLIDHIGILSNGDVVPCCLDSNGTICLGNIFNDSFDDILSSGRVNSIITGFKNNYKCEEFCRHCKFLDN